MGGRRGRKALPKSGSWKPTAFEAELLNRGIDLINSISQTNGKLERLHRSIEEEIVHKESLSEYVEYYNKKRLHFSLDIDSDNSILGQKGHLCDQKKQPKMDGDGRICIADLLSIYYTV